MNKIYLIFLVVAFTLVGYYFGSLYFETKQHTFSSKTYVDVVSYENIYVTSIKFITQKDTEIHYQMWNETTQRWVPDHPKLYWFTNSNKRQKFYIYNPTDYSQQEIIVCDINKSLNILSNCDRPERSFTYSPTNVVIRSAELSQE